MNPFQLSGRGIPLSVFEHSSGLQNQRLTEKVTVPFFAQ
jgi:hypothetical protein